VCENIAGIIPKSGNCSQCNLNMLMTFINNKWLISDKLHSICASNTQGVIIQMLQVYPDLFTNQTPPPVTAQEFEILKSFQIVQSDLGKNSYYISSVLSITLV
jgi:hypothetical protein